ncbi:MAG: hypothetical protein JWM27_2821 [Gemmatimonadetes bacterium]|nr:hypothetical protein [Gemmatimonadota bacterium]
MEFPPPPPRPAQSSSGCLKAGLLGCGGVLLLFVLIGVAGGIYFARNGKNIAAGMEDAERAGITTARTTDENGCVAAAEARIRKSGFFTGGVTGGVFLQLCLRSSRPTPGFCDGVPPASDFTRSSAWQRMRCQARSLNPREGMVCGALTPGIQAYCTGSREKVDPDSALAGLQARHNRT